MVAAAWAIGQLRNSSPHAVSSLGHALKDDNNDARLKAAWALRQVRDSSALPNIREALTRETNTDVRRALIRALTNSGGDAAQTMAQLIDSRDPQLREAAVRSLVGRNAFGPWPWPSPRPRPWP